MAQHKWAKNEENFLIQNTENLTDKELAESLRVTVAAVGHKLNRLGLRRSKEAISKNISSASKSSTKVQEHMRNLGKRMQTDRVMRQRINDGIRRSAKIKARGKEFGWRMAQNENRLFAVKTSTKLKVHAQAHLKITRNDAIFQEKRLQNLKKAIASSERFLESRKMEKNPNWRGGRSFSRESDYRGAGWKKIREEVLARDKHTCQFCGKTTNLVIHHIIGWHSIVQYKEVKNEVSEANYLGNLITTCTSCHARIERKLDNSSDDENKKTISGIQTRLWINNEYPKQKRVLS